MENLVSPAFWRGRRVFLTGHTGFKGGWLALWLRSLGAEVHGYALPPATTPNLFEAAEVGQGMASTFGDIRDPAALARAMQQARPEMVLHLAAQPLVAEGYRSPVETYATNVMGTANVLEACRDLPDLRAVVVVTTDKCYENREWPWAYRENEPLGGRDPYSSSKACAELVTAAYRQSFLAAAGIRVATARAGNVFGGGDWAPHRLVPDLLAAFASGQPARLRNPNAVRPWQHVLEPLAGYLQLAQALWQDADAAKAWNFGPADEDCRPVGQVATRLAEYWGDGARWQATATDFPHEAGLLRLDASLARQQLGWQPRWSLATGLARTVDWHKAWLAGQGMGQYCLEQIEDYCTPEK